MARKERKQTFCVPETGYRKQSWKLDQWWRNSSEKSNSAPPGTKYKQETGGVFTKQQTYSDTTVRVSGKQSWELSCELRNSRTTHEGRVLKLGEGGKLHGGVTQNQSQGRAGFSFLLKKLCGETKQSVKKVLLQGVYTQKQTAWYDYWLQLTWKVFLLRKHSVKCL